MTTLSFFLIPIFFLPFTADVLDLNKQLLLVVLTAVGLVAWLAQMISGRQFVFRAGWLNILPGLFLAAVFASSLFSVAGYTTWVGGTSSTFSSFLTTTTFVVLFYVLANTTSSIAVGRRALFALLLSATLSSLVTVLGLLNLVHLPFAFASSAAFNTVGTLNTFASFLSVVMFLGLAAVLVSKNGNGGLVEKNAMGIVTRVLVVLLTVMTVFVLLAVNYWMYWVLMIVGVFLLTMFGFLQPDEFPDSKTFILPLLVLLVSILFLFLPSPLHLNVPIVVSPSFGASTNIAMMTLKSNVRTLLLGSGPGTFGIDYALTKSSIINTSPLWSLSFDQSKSAFLTMLTTLGLVGALTWLALMGWVLLASLKRLLKDRKSEMWKMTYVIFVGWVLLLLAHFVDATTFTAEFLFWGLTGLLAAQILRPTWKADFSRSPKLGLVASFVFVLVAVGVMAGLFMTGERFAADVMFVQAVQLDQSHADAKRVIAKLQTAIQLNPMNDVYARNLSSAYLGLARTQIAALKGANATADQSQQISALVNASVQAATQAVQLEPRSAQNWTMLGSVYQAVMPFVQNGDSLAEQAFKNAIALEPSNPADQTSLGTLYLADADRATALKTSTNADTAKNAVDQEPKLWKLAEDSFNAAIKLKGDYLQAHYYLAAVYEREGKLDQATARLVALTQNQPKDVGLGFELAQLYLRTKQYSLAGTEFDRVIALNPKYANALWYRASVYEIQNNHDKAIELVKQVVALNPDNKDAQTRLQNLEAGQTTTSIPDPLATDVNGSSSAVVGPSDTAASTVTPVTTTKTKK